MIAPLWIISCDTPGCDASFALNPGDLAVTVCLRARAAGWTHLGGSSRLEPVDRCPECSAPAPKLFETSEEAS